MVATKIPQRFFAILTVLSLLVLPMGAQIRSGDTFVADPAQLFSAAHAAAPRLQEAYGALPLAFELNQGQMDGEARFLARGKGYSFFLTESGAVMALSKPDEIPEETVQSSSLTDIAPTEYTQSTIRMKFIGGNTDPTITGVEELTGKSNYFIGNDPAQWRTNVPTGATT